MSGLARRLLKLAVVGGAYGADWLRRPQAQGDCLLLIYHSVGGGLSLELDLPPGLFRRQLQFLADRHQVVHLDEAVARLEAGKHLLHGDVVLTFDDGYASFYTHVYPLLRQLALPATLYVTTGFVESGTPYPLLRHGLQVQPVTWEMLGEMMESGLVTIGAHTHTHPELDRLPLDQVVEEIDRPRELFRQRLGLDVVHFAYPKARWNATVEQAVTRSYRTAVLGGGRAAVVEGFDRYRIPRVPVRRSDGWFFFPARLDGRLRYEEDVYSCLHRWLRRAGSHSRAD